MGWRWRWSLVTVSVPVQSRTTSRTDHPSQTPHLRHRWYVGGGCAGTFTSADKSNEGCIARGMVQSLPSAHDTVMMMIMVMVDADGGGDEQSIC